MGLYLNSRAGAERLQRVQNSDFFVDKSNMIAEILPRFGTWRRYFCVTRPRRFGKSINASMLAAFLGKHPCPELFADLSIASHPDYAKHLNQHNVIFCTFNKQFKATNITQWLEIIEEDLKADLLEAYPECVFRPQLSISELFDEVTCKYPEEKFIFIFDEWDAVFEFMFVRDNRKAKDTYLGWLQELFNANPFVEFAYLTGIKPLGVLSCDTDLDFFENLTFRTDNKLQQFFGFTEDEVDVLYQQYLTVHDEPSFSLEQLAHWYNGYDTVGGLRVYNPWSVTFALRKNMLQSYWTRTGPYDEIYRQVKNNIPEMFDLIPELIADIPLILEYYCCSAVTGTPKTRDEILSVMLAYGFLSIKGSVLRVPNHELMLRFVRMVETEPPFVEGLQLAKFGAGLVEAISQGDSDTVAAMIEQAHNRFSGRQSYSTEQELAGVVKYAFCCTPWYVWDTEVTVGRGGADLVLFPMLRHKDLIIIELKVDASPQQAIEQIKSRNYQELAAVPRQSSDSYTGRIIAVGISYNRQDPAKQHGCVIEVLREAQVR